MPEVGMQEVLQILSYGIGSYFFAGNLNNSIYYIPKFKRDEDISENGEKEKDLKCISIMIPAFDESKVIGDTLRNMLEVDYPDDKYEILVGTYEADTGTRRIVQQFEREFPNIREVPNPEKPPTTKAQNLNNIYRSICENSEIVGIQDAEDRLSKNILKEANRILQEESAVQFKVVPHERGKSFTEKSYGVMFGKLHNFNLPRRERFGFIVPSAGVGTYFRREVLDEIVREYGYLFDENNMTEDYELSIRLARKGYRIKFSTKAVVCEKFPGRFSVALKQRTRWAFGRFQTFEKHGIPKEFSFTEKMGLILDYMGLPSFLWFVGLGLTTAFGVDAATNYRIFPEEKFFLYLSAANVAGALEGLLLTPIFTQKEYGGGFKEYLKDIPATLSNYFLEAMSSARALGQYIKSKRENKRPIWDKTPRD